MKIIKPGGHRLFEHDPQTASRVSEMLLDLEQHGMDAVRKYSTQFDDWNPLDFELSHAQIEDAIANVSPQAIADTDFCQGNVRVFAEAQLNTTAHHVSADIYVSGTAWRRGYAAGGRR